VISPFVDKKHGTERAVAELVEHLASDFGHAVHVYSQRMDDVEFSSTQESGRRAGSIYWRRVRSIPGPHFLQFVDWYWRNRRARAKDQRKNGEKFDAVFSAGINCSDANVILVHAVFHRLAELQAGNSNWSLRGIHRRIYYGLLRRLERKIYSDPRIALAAVSQRTANQLAHYFGRNDVRVIPNGVDVQMFHPAARESLRSPSRERFDFSVPDIVALLIGNDWRNKGLGTLLQAAAKCADLPLRLLIVGGDDPADWRAIVSRLGLEQKVQFVGPSANVMQFYGAADILVAPSLEDSFNLPVLEAMACGLPAITSTEAGVASLLKHGEDCFILEQPKDPDLLASYLRRLCKDETLRRSLGEKAIETASRFTWKKNVSELAKFMEDSIPAKYNLLGQQSHQ
jgi:glycosyltransferase involved in cell wall biosynthesis